MLRAGIVKGILNGENVREKDRFEIEKIFFTWHSSVTNLVPPRCLHKADRVFLVGRGVTKTPLRVPRYTPRIPQGTLRVRHGQEGGNNWGGRACTGRSRTVESFLLVFQLEQAFM